MNLTQALDFIHAESWQGSRLGLERIRSLLHRLGDPQKELKFIHVAGSNGKGSTCAMLSSILTAAGYRTGLYTSPHLWRVNERMHIDGADISDAALCALAETVRPAVESMAEKPTEFELLTAMALLHFRQQRCDVVVLEVGLGGRLDSTNAIDAPEVAVITHIALEHTEILGHTLPQIAAEKAGIIKPGTAVVLYHQDEETHAVIQEACRRCGAPLTLTDPAQETLHSVGLEGQLLSYRERRELRLSLPGPYQARNAAVALDTVDVLIAKGWHISPQAVKEGLAAARWPGRFEVLQRSPLVLVDGAHNPDGAAELAGCLARCLPGRRLTFVMGVMADKDYRAMISAIAPFAERFITVTPDSPRALPSAQLREVIAREFTLPAADGGTVDSGLTLAMDSLGQKDALCAFGSLYQAGAVRHFFGKYR